MLQPGARQNYKVHINVLQLPFRNANVLRYTFEFLILNFHFFLIRTLGQKIRNIVLHPHSTDRPPTNHGTSLVSPWWMEFCKLWEYVKICSLKSSTFRIHKRHWYLSTPYTPREKSIWISSLPPLSILPKPDPAYARLQWSFKACYWTEDKDMFIFV